MTKLLTYIKYLGLCLIVSLFFACQQPGKNITGSEYMPDMGHSLAYEANQYNYYYQNTWGTEDEYYKYASPREPVKGTVARGYAGNSAPHQEVLSIRANGSVPFYYEDTEEDRARAIEEIIQNPYPITDEGLSRGKELYEVFCGICHGNKGDGAGYLVRDDGGKYPVQPANLLLPEFISASNGRYYYTLMHGRNKMGNYKDKISYEERWQVIHYVRALQAKELKVDYNQITNTLNDVEQPAGASYSAVVEEGIHEHSEGEEAHTHGDDEHGSSEGQGHGVSDNDHGDHH